MISSPPLVQEKSAGVIPFMGTAVCEIVKALEGVGRSGYPHFAAAPVPPYTPDWLEAALAMRLPAGIGCVVDPPEVGTEGAGPAGERGGEAHE